MKKTAFTLIELLVVLAVIAVLMGTLMPTLGKARQMGQSIVCANNLRQLLIVTEIYTGNNKNYYPPSYVNDPNPMDMVSIKASWDFTSIKDFTTGEKKILPGLLWSGGETTEKIHQCPAYKGPPNSDSQFTGYNYNTSFIGRANVAPAKTVNVKRPAECIIYGDGQFYRGVNKYMRSPFKSKYDSFSFRAAGTQGFRHNGKTNIAWCDGHISSQDEYYTETIPGEKAKLDKYNMENDIKIGFISPDNSAYDLK